MRQLIRQYLIRRAIRRTVREVDRQVRRMNLYRYGTETPARGMVLYGTYMMR